MSDKTSFKITVEVEVLASNESNASANVEDFLDEVKTYNQDLLDEYSVSSFKQVRVEKG